MEHPGSHGLGLAAVLRLAQDVHAPGDASLQGMQDGKSGVAAAVVHEEQPDTGAGRVEQERGEGVDAEAGCFVVAGHHDDGVGFGHWVIFSPT